MMGAEDRRLCSAGAMAGTMGRCEGTVSRWQMGGSGQLAGMGVWSAGSSKHC